MTNWLSKRWSWTSVALQEILFPTLKPFLRKGLVTGQQTTTGFPSMQWHVSVTQHYGAGSISSAEPVAVVATLCLMTCLLNPALYYTCAKQVPSFPSRMYPALIVEVLFLKIHELVRITRPCLCRVIPIPSPVLRKVKHPEAWCGSRYNCFPSQAVFCLSGECLGLDPQIIHRWMRETWGTWKPYYVGSGTSLLSACTPHYAQGKSWIHCGHFSVPNTWEIVLAFTSIFMGLLCSACGTTQHMQRPGHIAAILSPDMVWGYHLHIHY